MAQILVVDDDDTIRSVIIDILADSNHSVEQAGDGMQAEALVLSHHFDLVVSDIQMPNMNGIDLLKRVRFMQPQVKFVLMTGFHKPRNIPICLEQNVSRYIKKPINLPELAAMIEDVLQETSLSNVKSSNMNMEGWLEMELTSSDESLLRVHHLIREYLGGHMDDRQADRISFAFFEMAKNAIEWGNRNSENLLVRAGCMVFSDRVVFKVEDQGQGFDVGRALCPIANPFERQADRMQAGKRPGGYGIEMTRSIMDQVFYSQKGNCVVMTKMI